MKKEIGIALGVVFSASKSQPMEIKCRVFAGNGEVSINGVLGKDALDSFVTSIAFLAKEMEVDFSKLKLRLDVPVAIDGKSIGLSIASAIFSAVTKTPISQQVGITGVLNKDGYICRVEGIERKFEALQKNDLIKGFMLPICNLNDLAADSYFKKCYKDEITASHSISLASVGLGGANKLKFFPVSNFKTAFKQLAGFD